jgi:ubiquinone/menaquinone biosynthesis C-methylase UbiE
MARHIVNWYKPILSICEQIRPYYCLDVGCGHGLITEYLRNRGIFCVGLDVDIRNLKSNIRSLFVRADAQSLPFKSGVFDMVLALELLEHLPTPKTALAEFHRVLKPKGYLILTTPTPKSPTAKLPGHINVKPRNYWIWQLILLGFNVKIFCYMYEIGETTLPWFIEKLPEACKRLIQYLLSLYKRYISVTSTKLLCIKESF